jgi:formimidoylglutamate deiminase
MAAEASFFARSAWIAGAWRSDVLLRVDAQGHWSQVTPGADEPSRAAAQALSGPVLPGLVNAHGHAFQRAIAGLAERSGSAQDDFWSWRDRMYSAANRITPDQLQAIASFLYAELLAAGYTQVCEFHYLHNDVDGKPYAQEAEMALALVRAAREAGIGITVLPTLYMRSGFGSKGLREDQRRFASTPESVLRIAHAVRQEAGDGLVTSGVALHSLRAVEEGVIAPLVHEARGPIHVHVCEQQLEVDDCIARHGRTPVEWLLEKASPDERWNMVHATQCKPDELEGLRRSGASVVLCPSTEANLGDGVFRLRDWMGMSGRWSIGSDSHVTRAWTEELRLLEYSQRFVLKQRNVAARAAESESTAAALFEGALEGGSAAAGLLLAGIAVGQRADFMVLDAKAPAFTGVPDDHLLDAMVFSSPDARPREVYVAGRKQALLTERSELSAGMRAAMKALWA